MGKKEHLREAPEIINTGILTVSSTRTEKNDKSGLWIKKQAEKEGHRVAVYRIISDDKRAIATAAAGAAGSYGLHALILSGGTGIGSLDVTIEAVKPMLSKEMDGFSALFAWLSYEKIYSAAVLSRSMAGIMGSTAVFCLPGSLDACKLACRELIFPEIRHIAAHLR